MSEIRPTARRARRHRRLERLGLGLVGLAVVALVYELLPALGGAGWRVIPAGELWFTVDVGSLNLVQAVIQRYIHPALWDPILAGILQWPLWSLFGAPGAALAVIYRKAEA